MWWIGPAVIALAVISMAIPMTLDYLAEKKENKNNDDGNYNND